MQNPKNSHGMRTEKGTEWFRIQREWVSTEGGLEEAGTEPTHGPAKSKMIKVPNLNLLLPSGLPIGQIHPESGEFTDTDTDSAGHPSMAESRQ